MVAGAEILEILATTGAIPIERKKSRAASISERRLYIFFTAFFPAASQLSLAKRSRNCRHHIVNLYTIFCVSCQ
jgi:prepilin signal peptidase PulO-like enzyme (type II secretory pathway)